MDKDRLRQSRYSKNLGRIKLGIRCQTRQNDSFSAWRPYPFTGEIQGLRLGLRDGALILQTQGPGLYL